MTKKVPFTELEYRMTRFRKRMDASNPDWEIAVIFSKINLYYFTGTMQDGMLIVPRDEEATFWVRRSYERALDESLFSNIEPMNSFRDAAGSMGKPDKAGNESKLSDAVYLETEVVPLALYQRFQKYFPFKYVKSVDTQIASVRTVKSEYELSLLRESGRIHQHVLEDLVPEMLREGMSEADLATELFSVLIKEGHHGVSRFGMFDTEMILGNVCFGESSIYPTYFNGPGGKLGLCPAVPLLGSRDRKLRKGDLVFVDVGCGVEGYHTDKTTTYMFGSSLPQYAIDIHNKCVAIQNEAAAMLKPGAIPSEIYNTIMNGLDEEFLQNFMGFGGRKVKFLGHGVGLLIDETPVIAAGFDEPLREGMVFALEPKRGIENIGMVGIENTFIVTADGGECITGNNPGLIPVY
ncbi:peptidase M24 [Methanosarcina sp. 1.H.T.1A.1]|uniref:M24 family metallopeptidase n=1 Tax=Methanosarcina sp. 1.H.T.1A.1 TaxID=1483602 RepID=UPI0006225F0D|nr:Xaa-Pro peptidase family protein [Methanosarcina sp. 1.H.T.1A.1]KKH92811.1 peptidase M24 [Methanosarcina sp. 1.H.T.1A.1]